MIQDTAVELIKSQPIKTEWQYIFYRAFMDIAWEIDITAVHVSWP